MFSAIRGGLQTVAVLLMVGITAWWWAPALQDKLPSGLTLFGAPDEAVRGNVVSAAAESDAARDAADAAAPVARAVLTAAPTATPVPVLAPYCPPGQPPRFVLGFAKLKESLGDVMGEPIECEHGNPENGDTLQQTTTGLAVFRKEQGALEFTDGWNHYALQGDRIVHWEGDARPSQSAATVQEAAQPQAAEMPKRMRVVNTDGLGVVLRSAPEPHARLPRGFMEGTVVTVLEQQGEEWTHVRGDNGLDGWVPTQYLAPAE